MSWNGGSYNYTTRANTQYIIEIINFFQEQNIPLKFTLTNPVLELVDCYDRYSNTILALAENELNEILIVSPILENFIRNKYPNYKINRSIISTTGQEETLDNYLQELEKYNKIVLPRRLVKDQEFLLSIPVELRNRFELLCNDPCDINCPRLYSHYEDLGYAQLGSAQALNVIQCSSWYETPFKYAKNFKYQISLNEINNFYKPNQFSEFKLSGRGININIILSIVPYLIKPEYQRDMYELLLNL